MTNSLTTPAESAYQHSLDDPLATIDPYADLLIRLEEKRQHNKIILIPSESIASTAVRQALGSVFTNLYAEGYPATRTQRDEIPQLMECDRQLACHRRYADRRFYKGTEFVDFVECLAQKRAAQLFATAQVPAAEIHANVQPLSGAAANNAVYEALLTPGDVIMGMDLTHGGHLTHGSPYNRSGKYFKVYPYGVNPATGRLDYEAVQKIALEVKPKLIVAGASAYPWTIDWAALRQAADAVGAYLMADIAHPAGLVVAGLFPNPIGQAHVVTFTTHKTILGPRGAVILCSDDEIGKRLDRAIFPGEQGGPHINNMAAIAVAFAYAATPEFRALQQRIVQNAIALAEGLQRRGLKLAYGGTDTHMLLVDLNAVPSATGFPLKGDVASRILDICGLVVNKNTIPGDLNAAYSSAIRLGTVWATQRGLTTEHMDRLAGLIHRVVTNIQPFRYFGTTMDIARGKIDLPILEEVRAEVSQMVRELESPANPQSHHNPRGAWTMPLHFGDAAAEAQAQSVFYDQGDAGLLRVHGERARAFLHEVGTADILSLPVGGCRRTVLLDKEGRLLDDPLVLRLEPDACCRDCFLLVTHAANTPQVVAWLEGLSDGYTIFDPQDIYRKIQGPITVNDLGAEMTALGVEGPQAAALLGRLDPSLATLAEGHLARATVAGVDVTVAAAGHKADAPYFALLVPFQQAGDVWPALLTEGQALGVLPVGLTAREQRRALVGLPTYADDNERPTGVTLYNRRPDLFGLTKPYFIGQAAVAAAASPAATVPEWQWTETEQPTRRTCLYEEHLKLKGRVIPFAGWLMPVWYTGISEEHQAVRTTAGLFDIAHMGVLGLDGEGATRFLDLVTSNYTPALRIGQSHYAYLLGPDGRAIDDIFVYRLGPERYMMVVNAANADKDFAWLQAVASRQYNISLQNPAVRVDAVPRLRNLKDPQWGDDQRVDVGLQGPRSLDILLTCVDDAALRHRIARLKRSELVEGQIADMPVIISRTGYTGEAVGFELYVHPDQSPRLWNLLLEKGQPFGIKPAGLGARDSTRTEAGLPLYGHELEGPYTISPIGAGYASFVRLHKPFFIGREALIEQEAKRQRQIVSFRLSSKGVRMAKLGDPVVSAVTGQVIGYVTSSALAQGYQVGMAYVDKSQAKEGNRLGIFVLGEKVLPEKGKRDLAPGDRVLLHSEATVIPRFGLRKPETTAVAATTVAST
jgi:glycine cleavage system T protein